MAKEMARMGAEMAPASTEVPDFTKVKTLRGRGRGSECGLLK